MHSGLCCEVLKVSQTLNAGNGTLFFRFWYLKHNHPGSFSLWTSSQQFYDGEAALLHSHCASVSNAANV